MQIIWSIIIIWLTIGIVLTIPTFIETDIDDITKKQWGLFLISTGPLGIIVFTVVAFVISINKYYQKLWENLGK